MIIYVQRIIALFQVERYKGAQDEQKDGQCVVKCEHNYVSYVHKGSSPNASTNWLTTFFGKIK